MVCSPMKEWLLDIMNDSFDRNISRWIHWFPERSRREKRSESLFANTRVSRAAAGHVLRVRQSARDIATLAIKTKKWWYCSKSLCRGNVRWATYLDSSDLEELGGSAKNQIMTFMAKKEEASAQKDQTWGWVQCMPIVDIYLESWWGSNIRRRRACACPYL